jgi:hypothetical protein
MSEADAFTEALSQAGEPSTNGQRPDKWPRLPGHDADLATIRAYLTAAANLPAGWVVESAERHGQYGSDPMTITVRTPGEAPNVVIRFEGQRECSKPAALRAAFAEATDGASRMRNPSPAQAGDYYIGVCALARVTRRAGIADETWAWLHTYTASGTILLGHSLRDRVQRYDALAALQARTEFDVARARRYVANDLHPDYRWTLLIDAESDELWLRVGELTTYVRNVLGERIAQHTLDARVQEIGGERWTMEEDRRRSGMRHIILRFYGFPSAQGFPRLTRAQGAE